MLFSTGLLQAVVTAAAMLFSTGLSQVVDTELQQCCFQQLVTDLLQPRKAPYEVCVSTILNKKRPNRLPYFGCSVS
jgi:hypothetical protein